MCAPDLSRSRSWKNAFMLILALAFCPAFFFSSFRSFITAQSFQADLPEDRKVRIWSLSYNVPTREMRHQHLFNEAKVYFLCRLWFEYSSLMQIMTANTVSTLNDQIMDNALVASIPTLEDSFSSALQIKLDQTHSNTAHRMMASGKTPSS